VRVLSVPKRGPKANGGGMTSYPQLPQGIVLQPQVRER
jgi:hypothetical protein